MERGVSLSMEFACGLLTEREGTLPTGAVAYRFVGHPSQHSMLLGVHMRM